MVFFLRAVLLVATVQAALAWSGSGIKRSASSAKAWPGVGVKKIKNIVTFGDSYTDSGQVWIATGGLSWPQYTSLYTGVNLYPFAYSGATCNNISTPRRYFGDVTHNELGDFFNFTATNKSVVLRPEETLYTLWIGTNDVGGDQLITGGSAPGTTVVDVASCSVDWIKTLYKHGARNFLFQNMIPLDQTPMYAADSWPNRYWTAPRNTTQWNLMMKELVASGNALTKLLVTALAPSLPEATIGYFDSYSFFDSIYTHPQLYLNGTAPLNVTSAVRKCVFYEGEDTGDTGDCTVAEGTDKDSFMWYDELHPSEQTDRVVARAVSNLIQGTSQQWTTFYYGPK